MLFQRPQRYAHLITTALPQKVYACQHLPAILQPADKRTYLSIAEPLSKQQQQQRVPSILAGLPLQASSSGEAGPSLHSLHAAPASHLQHQHTQHEHLQQAQHSGGSGSSSSSSAHVDQPAAGGQLQEQQLPSVHLFPEGGMTNGKGGHTAFYSKLVGCN
jgi:hypothetical protein